MPVLAPASPGAAGKSDSLTADEAVRLALEASPAVAAARSRLEGAAAGVREARALHSPVVEAAPGVGFTNGNAVLWHQIDIRGQRSAETRAARGLHAAAQAELQVVRLRTAAAARAAYYELVLAMTQESTAAEAAALVRQLSEAVRRRVQIGEAPVVQATRSEIEAARAEQEVIRAKGLVRARRAALNLLLGRAAGAALDPADTLSLPQAPAATAELLAEAQRLRPDLAVTRGLIEARRGDVAVARSQRRPQLFAEVATDAWSLDREQLRTRNIGFQARLTVPLFDLGRLRAGVERARASVREQEAELASASRALEIEIEESAAQLIAARAVASDYQTRILPRAQELVQATRSGFEAGLTSFLEVLEAQRAARQTQGEYLNALFEAVRARIALDRALGSVPGLNPASGSAPSPERSPVQ
jgi:outer membrane protein TolC